MSILNLQNRLIETTGAFYNSAEIVNTSIDYDKVNKILAFEIKKSKNWLYNALEQDKNIFREPVEARFLHVLLAERKVPEGIPYMKRAFKKSIKIINWILRQIKRLLFIATNNVNFLK